MKKLLTLLLQGTGVTAPFGPHDFTIATQAEEKAPKKLGLRHSPRVKTSYPEANGYHYPAPPADVFDKISGIVHAQERILNREIPFYID